MTKSRPIRARRMKLLYDAALKILRRATATCACAAAMRASFSREELAQLLDELFRLYAEEVRSLSRSVRLPGLLVPLRELIAQELLTSCCGSHAPLALEIAATVFRKTAEARAGHPPRNPEGTAD
jgi:hypothetical protein